MWTTIFFFQIYFFVQEQSTVKNSLSSYVRILGIVYFDWICNNWKDWLPEEGMEGIVSKISRPLNNNVKETPNFTWATDKLSVQDGSQEWIQSTPDSE